MIKRVNYEIFVFHRPAFNGNKFSVKVKNHSLITDNDEDHCPGYVRVEVGYQNDIPPGKSDEAILQNICFWGLYGYFTKKESSNFEKALLWKFGVCTRAHQRIQPLLEIFLCVLVPFLVLLENLACSYKRILSSPRKFICFLITSKPL